MLILKLSAIILAFVALAFDLKTYKIPNVVNLLGMIIGLITSFVIGGKEKITSSLLGFFIAFLIMFILFVLGAIGAGDVKLMCALGTMLHVDIIFVIILAIIVSGVCGGLLILSKIKSGKYIKITKIHMTLPIFFSVVFMCCYTGW